MEKIIEELQNFNRIFPAETIKDAIKVEKEITPLLLEELDRILKDPEIVVLEPDTMLHLYALFLLSQFREKRAFPKIIELISFPESKVEILLGDVVTEDLPSILYSTYDGNVSLLKQTIENEQGYIYVRAAALDVYGKLYADGFIAKEELINYLRTIIKDHLKLEESELAVYIQNVVIDRHIFEMVDDVQTFYDENQIDIMLAGEFDDFIDEIYSYNHDNENVSYIDDTIKRMSWWACFEQSRENRLKLETRMNELGESLAEEKEQLAEKKEKVGRNDPCPCRSGKKYKKCCLRKEIKNEDESVGNYLETIEEQEKRLQGYPVLDQEKEPDEMRLSDVFDNESIEIDRLVYLALHRRIMPNWEKRDKYKADRVKVNYLQQAFDKFIDKCDKEDINSFDAYDSKYKIHYRSSEWVNNLASLIEQKELETIYNSLSEKVKKVVSCF